MIDDSDLPKPLNAADPSARTNFLHYPASRLAPRIVPQDLTTFKTRGITKVERELQRELTELRENYLQVIDAFNWNKLVYEAHYGFEPIIGETYHLYVINDDYHLSMIGPEQWSQRWVGTFMLNADARWQPVQVSDDFDLRDWVGDTKD
ncbi:MAG: DUF2452 domain-containing protein [Verrucomicrobiaceae bacterium]|nr:DUF2452 domain-containing protein [Verrucomicrobiaceae bacterium]